MKKILFLLVLTISIYGQATSTLVNQAKLDDSTSALRTDLATKTALSDSTDAIRTLITNLPDNITLENKTGSTIGIKSVIPSLSLTNGIGLGGVTRQTLHLDGIGNSAWAGAAEYNSLRKGLILGSDNAVPSYLALRMSRNTFASPTALQIGDVIGAIAAEGYHGSGFIYSGDVRFVIDDTVSTNIAPAKIQFTTQPPTGGGRIERMTIFSNGMVDIGSGVKSSTYRFNVGGSASIGGTTAKATESLRLQGMGVLSATYFGNYGGLILDANASFTSNARRYLITNSYLANRFAIIRSVDATTDPSLGGSGSIASGTADFSIDYNGAVYLSNDLFVNGGDIYGTTDGGTRLRSDTNIEIYLDDDNDGTNLLQILDGANSAVFVMNEAGELTTTGTIFGGSDLVVGGSDLYSPTDGALRVRSDTNIEIYIDDDNDGTNAFQVLNGANAAMLFLTETGNATLLGSLTTSAPTGGAGAWELGVANAVSPTAPNRTLTVEIDGIVYYIHAKTTND